ncbi:LGFP repeat-containing protein [Tychonema sp. LEGE 07203]|uniref:LGFP repeat-containing protein n=1 Tax=Tychonema sp. LEGE 07203 TaxID=1828671 RepID=UPI001880AD3E|nr:hypothetical protein [Tychonema sp. LEGE 07203]MBE9094479.1 hypothetical protein [Tychonema sp. LEGE 07203]
MGNNVSNFFTPEFNNESAIAPWNSSLEPTKAIIPKLDANRVLTGGVGQEVNLPTLTPEAYDNIILPDASLTRMASAVSTESNSSLPDSSVDLLTGQAMSEVYGDLSKFAGAPDFAAKLNVAFGENWNPAAAKALAEEWFQGDFSDIPPVKVVSSAEIGGANGAFAAATDTIYLSKEFLAENAGNPGAIADVLLEEIGHSVDARLNVTDSPGDEGAIFGAVVQGKELSEGELQGLKSEDDTATVLLDGHQYLVEKQLSSFPIQGSIGSFYNRNPAIASQLGRATSAEFQFSPAKWRQNFQNGAIFHSAQGTRSVRGSLGSYYLNVMRGQDGQLGLPTSEESHIGNGNWRQSFENGVLNWLNNGTAQVQLNGGSASLVKFGSLSGNDRNLPGTVFPYTNPFANISNTTPERWLGDPGQRARYIQDPEMPVVANTQSRSADQIRQVINYFNVEDQQNLRYKPNGWATFCNIFARDVMRALRAPLPHWINTRELDANGMNDWLNNSANGWKKVTPQDATKAASQGIPTVASWKNVGGIGHIAVVRPEAGPTPDNPQIAQAGATNKAQTTVSVGFGQTKNVSYFTYG